MNLLIYLIAGAIVGYIASRIMRTNSQQGLILDIVVGVVGAFLAGWFLTPIFGVGTINEAITLPPFLVTLGDGVVTSYSSSSSSADKVPADVYTRPNAPLAGSVVKHELYPAREPRPCFSNSRRWIRRK